MTTNFGPVFVKAVDWVLAMEGVFSDDACDSGGKTKFGHATTSWPATLARMPADVRARMPANVCDLDKAQAIEAYYWSYWITFGCDKLIPAFALLVFDGAVNGGSPKQWMQHALGVTADGSVGPKTLAAMHKLATQEQISDAIAEFQAWHIGYLTSLPIWTVFGATNGTPKGWSRRAFTMALDALRIQEEFGSAAPPDMMPPTA